MNYKLILGIVFLMVVSCQHILEPTPTRIHIEYPLEAYSPHGHIEEIELANGNVVYMDEDSVFFSGDMIFPVEMIREWNESDTKTAMITSTDSSPKYWWPSYSIPYYIYPGFSTTALNAIQNGIQMVASVAAGLSFTAVSSAPSNGISFNPTTNTNSSPIGRVSGGNIINLQNNLYLAGVVAHEIMHSLGFFHEQSRTDRNNYVIIYPSNIIAGHSHNYDTYDQHYSGYNFGSYDYSSIMHYGSYDFSINTSSPAMLKTDYSVIYKQRDSLTTGDKAGLYYLYGHRGYVESQVKNADYQEGGDWSSERDTYKKELRLNRDLTTSARLFIVKFTRLSSRNGGLVDTYTSYSNIVVPAHSDHYPLPDTYYLRDVDMGIVTEYEETYYEVVN